MTDTALIEHRNADSYRASTDAAGLCREIVIATASTIGGKSYVGVEGWQAIAVAHGCAASADCVERVTDEGMTGFRAIGIVRRMSDGAEIARAEGFLGDDETIWTKRPVYARRAMVQTRAISRACRSAFAHVVVMMKANLDTTPAEEALSESLEGNVMPETKPGRKKPEPLSGNPYRTRAEARIGYGEIVQNLHACGDSDQLEAYLATDAKAAVAQFEAELPDAWNGDGADFIGLKAEIERARENVVGAVLYGDEAR